MATAADNESSDTLGRIFIATSSETMESAWFGIALETANKRLRETHDDIELTPWTIAFKAGDVTAEKLIDLATKILGAVVVFAGNDVVLSKGQSKAAPRDNLVLEAGIFISRLGLKNVLLLHEKDSKWPSDLLGVTSKQFSPPPTQQAGTTSIVANEIARRIVDFIDELPHRKGTSAGAALTRTATKMMESAVNFEKRLESPVREDAIVIYDPRDAYIEALNHVERTFATTTYLDSGFWTDRDLRIVGANQRMLTKIKEAEGTARRLIILSRPISEELDYQRRQRRLLRSGAPDEIVRMDHEYGEFAHTNLELIDQGFEVKVVHDANDLLQGLPDKMFRLGDTELALYDKARVDSFSGFTSKNRSQVRVYDAQKFLEFEILQERTENSFSTLWDSHRAENFADFSIRMQKMMDEVANEIDYSPNWLALYDRAGGEDGELKETESELVRRWLEKRHGAIKGFLRSHIDLGTCTGRYVKELHDYLRDDALVVAVDMDPDCVRLVKLKQNNKEIRFNAVIREADIRRRAMFSQRTYDLVTCMMGTLCHFVRQPQTKGVYQDEWQTGLDNISRLLASDGDAFVAVWDGEACQNGRNVLEIYDERSRSILCRQSPPGDELHARIKQSGLEVLEEDTVQDRLRVIHLGRA